MNAFNSVESGIKGLTAGKDRHFINDMNLQPTDIIIRQTNGAETLWISQRLLMSVCEVSESYLKDRARPAYKKSVRACDLAKAKDFMPDSGKSWRWAKTAHGFYYCYDNIPDRKPTEFRSKLGTKDSLKESLNTVLNGFKADLNQHIKSTIITKAKAGIKNEDAVYYMYEAEVGFSKKQAAQLAYALSFCRFLKECYNTESFKTFGITKKQDFLTLCVEILEPMKLTGLKVSSAAYLRRKITEFPDALAEQRNYLISDKHNNDNARKVGKSQLYDEETGEIFQFDAHEALMYNAYMNPGGTTKEAIRKLYTNYYVDAIQDFGFEPIAYRTFCQHLAMYHKQIKMAKARHGKDYYKKHFLTYVPSKKLQFSHSLFAGDGSGTINYKYYKKNAKGGKDLNTMKLYVILISDIASRKIVGWAPAPEGQHKESPEMLEQALKMAIDNCSRMTMFEFISDNHGAFTSSESKNLLNLVFNKVRTIEVGNSQGNPAETEFRLFKKSLKSELNFVSASWNTGIEGQSNPDHFEVDNLPTYADAVLQFHDIVERWNSRPLRDETTPNLRFTNRNPNCLPMDERILRLIYGNKTQVDAVYMRGFIKVSKTKGYEHRDDYIFEIPDHENTGSELISKAIGYKKNGKLEVVWDEDAADIYTLEGKYVMTCQAALLASSAYIESDDTNKEALGHHAARKRKQENSADEFEQMIAEIQDSLPYIHEMKAGGNKETYNGKMEDATKPEELKKHRNNRDFDESEWENI